MDEEEKGPEFPPTDQFSVPQGFIAEVFADSLDMPSSIASPPDSTGRIFVNEMRTGIIRIIQDGELLEEPFARVPVNMSTLNLSETGEGGLIDIAFDPNYEANRYVYVTYATRTANGITGSVARFDDINNRGENFTVMLQNLPALRGHQPKGITVGSDGKIYVAIGDAFQEDQVRNFRSFHGKILRINPDGTIPSDNPLADSYVFAQGFRDVFGLIFRENGDLLANDNAPNALDEFNVVLRSGNYGWPDFVGETNFFNVISPVYVEQESASPRGMLFYNGSQFPARYQGKMFQVFSEDILDAPSDDPLKGIRIADIQGEGENTSLTFEEFATYRTQPDSTGPGNPYDLATDMEGNLYLSDFLQGKIFRIRTAQSDSTAEQ